MADPYSSLGDAQTALDPASHVVADCLAYYGGVDSVDLTALSATFDGTDLVVAGTFTSTSGSFGPMWSSVSLSSGDTITITQVEGFSLAVDIYDCDGTLVESLSDTGAVTSSPVPADSTYLVKVLVTSPEGACETDCIMTQVSGCADDDSCNPITYPIVTLVCGGTVNSDVSCPCGDPPAVLKITGQVRLHCTSLTSGGAYKATVSFVNIGPGGGTSSTDFFFTAPGASYDTAYVAIPNPGLDSGDSWFVNSCTIVRTDLISTCTIDLSASGGFTVNPVVALWDDSGTTRQLEACPKMLLPPLTESSGTWYASCADAHTVLVDPLRVSNCIGYWNGTTALITAFTATGGASLSFATTGSGGVNGDTLAYGSINAVAGDTLSMAFTDAANGRFTIYDDTGTLVEVVGPSGSSPLVSSPLPYTGRYIVYCEAYNAIFDPPLPSSSTTVTSSGTMSVNPIAATYDVGVSCPALLNCGDSCP